MRKDFFKSLLFRLILGILAGILLGIVLNEPAMKILVSVKNILAQLVLFCVPLIIIGFTTSAITTLGNKASKILGIAIIISYVSLLLSSLLSAAAGYEILPHIVISSGIPARELPEDILALDIPPVLSVISALVLSIMMGLAATWTKSSTVITLFEELQNIVISIVRKIIIPILPFYICSIFTCLSYNGTLTRQLPAFIPLILISIAAHTIWMVILYAAAGIYARKNPAEVFRYYPTVYITAMGTMSSAATMPIALECIRRSKVLRRDMVDFGIPLFANVHLCGSTISEIFLCMAISIMLYGMLPAPGTMMLFCILMGIFAMSAPGIPGGTAMAIMGIMTTVLGFDSTGIALNIALYALVDSFATACNISSDGALILILSSYADRHRSKLEEK